MRRHRPHPQTALIALAVAASLTAVSCEASSPSHDPDPTVAAARPLTERNQDVLHDAEQRLIQSCMAARGFRTWPVPRRPLAEDRDFPYVIDDVRWASRHGYGSDLRAQREQLRTNDPNQRYLRRLQPGDRQRAIAAYNGEQPSAARLQARSPLGMTVTRASDGCTAQAQKQLYGDLTAWFRADVVTGALPALRRQRVVADGEFKAAVKKWSACMQKRGLHYTDPDQARAAFIAPGTTSENAARRRQEVRTAVAEAECADDTGFTTAVGRLDRRYDAQLRDRYRNEVGSRLRMENAALPRARALLTTDRTDTTPTDPTKE
ncbi:hypothetical protein R6V09_43170 [Streptomyces sp. W16]|uniref:hypothetical protein n=1 Tax=Streptomyces sp. W16 TaxID=3076631 RepID=UPI00295B4819|nr:hypothetical protein [Streptomyces sp. W16]MDV9176916.1 hypothetical protein [Streptomyces sp. W16]